MEGMLMPRSSHSFRNSFGAPRPPPSSSVNPSILIVSSVCATPFGQLFRYVYASTPSGKLYKSFSWASINPLLISTPAANKKDRLFIFIDFSFSFPPPRDPPPWRSSPYKSMSDSDNWSRSYRPHPSKQHSYRHAADSIYSAAKCPDHAPSAPHPFH